MERINEPAFYFPLANGRYEVSAGFSRLGKDFGNGPIDQQIFQFDNTFQRYRNNKLSCRRESLAKYYQVQDLRPEVARTVCAYLISQLCAEYPDKFTKTKFKNDIQLVCRLTGEKLNFGADYKLLNVINAKSEVPYISSLDAIACQLQEDIAVVQMDKTGDFLCALHLCSPNHWAAEEKIGKSFLDTHRPVPHMDTINQQSHNLFKAILEKGPYVRFAWGLATDTQLNHHPQPPPGIGVTQWRGRHFDPTRPELWLRVERQTLTGLKQVNAILFTIRTYFYDVKCLSGAEKNLAKICSAIESMSSETLLYKGLQQRKDNILSWLHSLRQG